MTEGSLSTTPWPPIYTMTVAVPKSIPTSTQHHPFLFYLYLSVITVARFPFLHGERSPIALFSFGQIDKFLQSYYKGKKPFFATPFALFMLPRPRPAAAP